MTSSESIQLTAAPRTSGKHYSRKHRNQMEVPAVVYGPKIENMNLFLRENELVKYNKSKFENTIFVLNSEDKGLNGLKVLKKETSLHPVTRRPVHIDLYAMDMTQTVRVYVEVKFDGKAEGVKNGGVLNVANREIEIECLPDDIPEAIHIDITNMQIDDNLHVSDLTIPEGVEVLSSEKLTLCTVSMVEEVKETPVEAAPAADGEAAPAAEGEAKEEKAAEGEKKD